MAGMAPHSSGEPRTVLLIGDNPRDARLIREERYCRMPVCPLPPRVCGGAHGRPGAARPGRGGSDPPGPVAPREPGAGLVPTRPYARPSLPVVVLTGSDDEELGNRAVQSGAQDYLIKGQVMAPPGTRTSLHHRARPDRGGAPDCSVLAR
jgi:phosphoserine phosphatase RsbU/P